MILDQKNAVIVKNPVYTQWVYSPQYLISCFLFALFFSCDCALIKICNRVCFILQLIFMLIVLLYILCNYFKTEQIDAKENDPEDPEMKIKVPRRGK